MNKAELIDKVAQKTKLTKTQSEMLLDAALEVIAKAVAKGEEVKLVGFGTFSMSARQSRKGRNPKTGTQVHIPATKVPKFKPGKDFREMLVKKSSNASFAAGASASQAARADSN